MGSDKQIAILTVLHLPVIGFPVFVQGAHGQAHEVLPDVDYLGGELSHLTTVSFFSLGFSLYANKLHDFRFL